MPRVLNVEPIFVVSDVARAVAHFEQLGFGNKIRFTSTLTRLAVGFERDRSTRVQGFWAPRLTHKCVGRRVLEEKVTATLEVSTEPAHGHQAADDALPTTLHLWSFSSPECHPAIDATQ